MKRYDLVIQYEDGHIHEVIGEDPGGLYVRYADYQDLEQKYKDLLMVMEEQYIKRPDPEEARKAIAKVKRLVKTQCEPCRRHGLTEEIAEAEAALLRLMGVEVERWQRNEDPRDANSVMSVFTPD